MEEYEGKKLTPQRLKIAIEEDSHEPITLERCRQILRAIGVGKKTTKRSKAGSRKGK